MKKIYVLSHGSYSKYCLPTGKYQKFDIKFIDNLDFRFYSIRFFLKFQLGFLLKLKIVKKIYYSFFTILLFGFNIRNDAIVIIFQRNLTLRFYDYLDSLKIKRPRMKLIFFLTNRLDSSSKPSGEITAKKSFFDCIFTYSKEDAMKYKINHVRIPIHTDEINLRKKCKKKYMVYFNGRDKERFLELSKISHVFKELNISFKFVIVDVYKKNKYKENLNIEIVKKPFNYKKILKDVNCSEIILDLYSNKLKITEDYTLRIVEALNFGKKIITNNLNLVHENFYNTSNILVFNNDTDLKSKLPIFLSKKPVEYKTHDYKLFHYTNLLSVIDTVH